MTDTERVSTGSTAANKATYGRFHDAMNSHDPDEISSTIDEVFEPDVLIHTPAPVAATGAGAMKDVFGRLHRAFPDLHVTVQDVIAEGDKVVGRNTVTGTQEGEYLGLPPSGKRITYSEVVIFRFAGRRIAESWAVVDVLSQLRQLDAVTIGRELPSDPRPRDRASADC